MQVSMIVDCRFMKKDSFPKFSFVDTGGETMVSFHLKKDLRSYWTNSSKNSRVKVYDRIGRIHQQIV